MTYKEEASFFEGGGLFNDYKKLQNIAKGHSDMTNFKTQLPEGEESHLIALTVLFDKLFSLSSSTDTPLDRTKNNAYITFMNDALKPINTQYTQHIKGHQYVVTSDGHVAAVTDKTVSAVYDRTAALMYIVKNWK